MFVVDCEIEGTHCFVHLANARAPTCIRRCYRRSDTNSRRRRSSGIDPRMQAEIDMFRRMMEEAALAITPQGGMTLDTRREYILNCLMTKVS